MPFSVFPRLPRFLFACPPGFPGLFFFFLPVLNCCTLHVALLLDRKKCKQTTTYPMLSTHLYPFKFQKGTSFPRVDTPTKAAGSSQGQSYYISEVWPFLEAPGRPRGFRVFHTFTRVSPPRKLRLLLI